MNESQDLLLRAQGVTKRFGGLVAVNSIDFDIPARSIVSLIGPNGAGKTTFFNIIAGIYDPTDGFVEFRGRRMIARPRRIVVEPFVWVLPPLIVGLVLYLALSALSLFEDERNDIAIAGLAAFGMIVVLLLAAAARPVWYQRLLGRLGVFRSGRPNDMVHAGLGRTFQNIRLFQNMTALENVQVGMHINLRANWVDAMFNTPRNRREEVEAAARGRELLELVGLKGRGEEVAKNLPYGDQRRLEVARALASDPALLLLDEPTAGMNPNETAEMIALIQKLRAELGLTVLLIEHDMKVVMGVSDRVTVLDHGEKIAEGTPDVVRRDPKVVEAYLGAPAA